MTRRRFRPDLDGQGGALESRQLLSGLAHAPSAEVSALAVLQVAGKRAGTFTSQFQDASTSVTTFKVAGNSPRIGRSTLSGTLRSDALTPANTGGTATLASRSGTLDLALTPSAQESGSSVALPRTFDANITGGTGVFAGATGSGTVNFSFRIHGHAPNSVPHGNVVVVYRLNLNPPTTA